MTDKGTKALTTVNIRISLLVWKLHIEIETAKERAILFTEVDAVSKLAAASFKLFLEYGVGYNNLLFFNFNSIFFQYLFLF
jgi:hypothetical protein